MIFLDDNVDKHSLRFVSELVRTHSVLSHCCYTSVLYQKTGCLPKSCLLLWHNQNVIPHDRCRPREISKMLLCTALCGLLTKRPQIFGTHLVQSLDRASQYQATHFAKFEETLINEAEKRRFSWIFLLIFFTSLALTMLDWPFLASSWTLMQPLLNMMCRCLTTVSLIMLHCIKVSDKFQLAKFFCKEKPSHWSHVTTCKIFYCHTHSKYSQ